MARLHGVAHRRDGSKIDGTATVSTSWNGNRAYPRNGQYTLDLGSNPRQRITVYVDGNRYCPASTRIEGRRQLELRDPSSG